jgi:hypothetical protein
MPRLAMPQELGGAYVYLLSDAASYTTGIDIPVAGIVGAWWGKSTQLHVTFYYSCSGVCVLLLFEVGFMCCYQLASQAIHRSLPLRTLDFEVSTRKMGKLSGHTCAHNLWYFFFLGFERLTSDMEKPFNHVDEDRKQNSWGALHLVTRGIFKKPSHKIECEQVKQPSFITTK